MKLFTLFITFSFLLACESKPKIEKKGISKTIPIAKDVLKKKAEKEPEKKPEKKITEPDDLGKGSDEQIQLMVQAKTSILNEDWDSVEKIFSKLVKSEPLSGPRVTAYIALANIYRDDDKPKKAIELLKELEGLGSKLPEVEFVLARAHADMGNTTFAIKAYQKTLQMQPDYLQAITELAGVYIKAGRKEDAEKMFYEYEKRIYKYAKILESKDATEAEQLQVLDVYTFLNDDRANQAIVSALGSRFPAVREESIKLVRDLRLGAVEEKLREMMDQDPDLRVRMMAKDALGVVKGAPKVGDKPVYNKVKKKNKKK